MKPTREQIEKAAPRELWEWIGFMTGWGASTPTLIAHSADDVSALESFIASKRGQRRYIELLSEVTKNDGLLHDWHSWAWRILRSSADHRCRAALLWWIEQPEVTA